MKEIEALFFDELDEASDIVRQCDACLDNVFFDKARAITLQSHYHSDFNTLSISKENFIIFTSTAIALVNKKAISFLNGFSKNRFINMDESLTQKFIQYGFLKRTNQKEPRYTETIDKLSSWIHLTDSCNLRCHYCFLPHDPKFLSKKMGNNIVDALVKTAKESGLKKIKLKYAGGEPLQNFQVLQSMHHYALSFSKNFEIDTSVLTNGTLLNKEKLQWIKEQNIRLVISLDNLEMAQPQRIFKGGKDSFIEVQKKILLAKEEGVLPYISITINDETIKTLPALLRWVLDEKLPFSINFYKGILSLDEESLIPHMLEAFKVIESNLPNHSLLNSLLDMTNFSKPHLRGCSVGQNYLIFDTEGKISQCPMTMKTPITSINEPNILEKIQDLNNPIQNRSIDEHEECKSCEWRYWCGGGCAVANKLHQSKSPYCEVYKRLFPEVLRLEGLRLLKKS